MRVAAGKTEGDAEAPSSPGLAVLALAAVRGVQALGRSAGALIHRIFLQPQEVFDERYASLVDRSSRALLNRLSRMDVLVIDERTGSAVIPTIKQINTHEPNVPVAPTVAVQMLHHVGYPSRAPVSHSCRAPERQGRLRITFRWARPSWRKPPIDEEWSQRGEQQPR